MQRDRVGEVPDHRARLRVAERMAAVVLHHDALDAARPVGLPVLALGRRLLGVGQLVPPAELLQEDVVELRIAGRDVGALRVRAVLGEQVDAVLLDAEVGAEVAAAVHHVARRVVQVGRAGMLQLGRAVARPRQAEVVAVEAVAGLLVDAALGAQRLDVEDVHVAHVRLQPLGRLAGVADRPVGLVDLAQDRLDLGLGHPALALHHLEIGDELLVEAELLRQLVHDHVVVARLEQRLDHLLAPLDRAVRCRHRAGALELRRRRQQVDGAIRVEVAGSARHRRHRRRCRRIRIDDDEQVELVHRPLHLERRASASSARGPRRTGRAGSSPGRSARSSRARRRSSAKPSCRAWSSCPARTAS